jgi:hypothetical protein
MVSFKRGPSVPPSTLVYMELLGRPRLRFLLLFCGRYCRMNIWDIPHSDKRERCRVCLKVLKNPNFNSLTRSKLLRFTEVCRVCYYRTILNEDKSKKTEPKQ